ncbi:unnamed protein product, partial [Arabidopsis halleri]
IVYKIFHDLSPVTVTSQKNSSFICNPRSLCPLLFLANNSFDFLPTIKLSVDIQAQQSQSYKLDKTLLKKKQMVAEVVTMWSGIKTIKR